MGDYYAGFEGRYERSLGYSSTSGALGFKYYVQNDSWYLTPQYGSFPK